MILKTDASRKRNGMRRFNKTLLNYDACLGNDLEKDVRKKSLCSFSWSFYGFAGFDGALPQTPQPFEKGWRKLHVCTF